jgi:hypothetical protein
VSIAYAVRIADTLLHRHERRIDIIEKSIIATYFVLRVFFTVPHFVMDLFHIVILATILPHLVTLAFIRFYDWFQPPIESYGLSLYSLVGSPSGYRYRSAVTSDLDTLVQIGHDTFRLVSPLTPEDRRTLYSRVLDLDSDSIRVIENQLTNEIVGFTIASTFTKRAWSLYRQGKYDYRKLAASDVAIAPTRSRFVYLGTAISRKFVRKRALSLGVRAAVHHAALLTRDHPNDALIFTSLSNRRIRRVAKQFGMKPIGRNFLGWPIWAIDLKASGPAEGDARSVLANIRANL